MEFTVKIDMGDLYINGEFVNQLCWNSEAVGYNIAYWLTKKMGYPSCDEEAYLDAEQD